MRIELLALLTLGCAKHLPPTMVPADTLTYETADGWTGEVRHFPAEGPPVLLVHGMGANHYNWDYREEVSLAHHLQQRGWDVWIPALRGDPNTTPPERAARGRIDFDQYAEQDLPAATDAVLEACGTDALYWVGHSMGGMLLYTALSTYPDKIRAGVAIASPASFAYQHQSERFMARNRWAVKGRGRIPARAMGRMTRGLGRSHPFYGRIAEKDNLDWPITNGLAKHALTDLPKPLALQGVGWFRTGRITRANGEPWLSPDDTPLLVMGAAGDKVAPEPGVAAACDIYTDCTYIRLGVADGFTHDYGHIDMVLGKTAQTDIYPLVAGFLESHR